VSLHRRTQWGLVILLAALVMVSPFSVDTFYPSFPEIAAEFALDDWQMQQTITVYMLPFAVMTLVQGPLSDALGRRPVVLGGLSLYAGASVACAFAPNYPLLLAFRALQGMSAGVGTAVGRAIVRDLHDGPQAQRLMNAITMVFALAPAIAPVIGGWIHVLFGWRSVFGFMVLVGVALLAASYARLPETHPPERRVPLNPPDLASTLAKIASNRQFMLLALSSGANLATIFAYVGAAPAIVLRHWQLEPTQFAWLFVPVITGIVGGAWISSRIAGRMAQHRQVGAGFAVTLAATGLSVMLHGLFASVPIVIQQVLIVAAAGGIQLVIPVQALRMLDLFRTARGSAASVQSCVMLGIGAFWIGVVVPALNDSLMLISTGALLATALALAIWLLAIRRVRSR